MSNLKYESENISIEELPQGCIITDVNTKNAIRVGDLNDVEAIVESLTFLKECWYGEQ